MKLSSHLTDFVIAFLIAAAILATWLVAVTFIVETRSALGSPYQHEYIKVDDSGAPYISRRSHIESEAGIRTLDGKLVAGGGVPYNERDWPNIVRSIETKFPNGTAQSARSAFSPRLFSWRAWNSVWYLVRQTTPSDPIYFEGFEWKSGRRIGYIGKNGFSIEIPAKSDRFPCNDTERLGVNWLSYNCPIGYDKIATGNGHGNSLFLISADKLFHIDLAQRQVEEMAVKGVPRYVNARYRHAEDWELTVRTDESFVLFNGDRDVTASFDIPEAIRDVEFLTLHRVSNSEAVIEASKRARGNRDVQLWKVTPDNSSMFAEVVLREQLSEIYSAPFRVLAAPSLLPLCFSFVELNTDDDYFDPEHKSKVRKEIGASIYFVAILSSVLGIFVFRTERRAGRSGLGWAIFIFLMGIPGLFGYWFHRKWPAKVTCKECYTVQAHRRLRCISCKTDMITGIPLATDIFA